MTRTIRKGVPSCNSPAAALAKASQSCQQPENGAQNQLYVAGARLQLIANPKQARQMDVDRHGPENGQKG